MLKRISSLFLSLVLVVGIVFSASIDVKAVSGSVSGTMRDTSSPDNGYIDWVYSYSNGRATLTLSGNGYMPNSTGQDWFAAQNAAGYYIYEVIIEEGVKSIMESAFAGEKYLEKITLPDSIEFVGDGAFAYTPLTSLNIPKKMGEITGSIFTGSAIKQFNVDSRNPYYKSYNGDIYSKDMKELVVAAPGKFSEPGYNFVIPQKVKTINESAFYCTKIENIKIPSNVTDVEKMAFAGCHNLSEVIVENGVRRFYDSVFLACSALKVVHLPASVDYIGFYTFGYNYSVDLDALRQMLDAQGLSSVGLNEYNYESYAELLGYSGDAFLSCVPDPEFKLYAPVNSVGHQYAQNFDIAYQKASVISKVVNKDSAMQISWSYSDNVFYTILYRKADAGSYHEIARFHEGETSYVDENISSNVLYTYSIKTVYMDGAENWDKAGISCCYVSPTKLRTIKITNKGVQLEWIGKNGETGYYIYRKAPGETSWKYLATVKNSTNYIDTTVLNNKRYSYNIRAIRNGFYSEMGQTPLETKFVKAPEFTVYNTVKGITVKWTTVSGAGGYKVFRKVSGGDWKLLKTVAGNKTAYADTNTKRGTTYQYAVRAVNGDYVSGYFTKSIKSVAAPMNLTIKNKAAGVSVSWNKCAGASGYYVYRKTASGTWKKIATVKGINNLSYVDKNVKSGIFYTYRVKAYSGSYVSTYVLDGIKIRFLAAPKISSAVSTKNGIKIKINAVNGSKGYYVLRRGFGESWVRIKTITNPNNLVYIDKTARKGKTYIYTIKAYNGSTVSGYYSNGAEVKDIY